MYGLTSDAFAGLKPASLKAMTPSALSSVAEASFKGITPDQVKALTADQVAALKNGQVALFGADDAANFSAAQVAKLTAERISYLTTDAIPAIPTNAISKLDISLLDVTKLPALTNDQFLKLSAAQIATIDQSVSGLVATITADQVTGVTTLNSLQAGAVPHLTANVVASLTPVQMGKFNDAHLAEFTQKQAVSFSDDVTKAFYAKGYSIITNSSDSDSGIETVTTFTAPAGGGEVITAGRLPINVTGDALAETIIGSAGVDTIAGGTSTGHDSIFAGAGNDFIIVSGEAHTNLASWTIDGGDGTSDTLTLSTVTSTLADSDLLHVSNVEKLALTGASTITVGTNANNAGIQTIVVDAATTTMNASAGAFTVDAASLGTNTLTLGGAGTITITGSNSNAETYQFAAGSSLASGNMDVITNYQSGSDKIKFGASLDVIADHLTTAAVNSPRIEDGFATFADLDSTTSKRVATLQAYEIAGSLTNKAVAFSDGTDTYVFSTGTTSAATDDQLIKLAGLKSGSMVVDTNVITRLPIPLVLTSATGTSTAIQAAFDAYTGTKASVVGTGLDAASVTVVVGSVAKIKAGGITSIALTPGQFATSGITTALATGAATVSATGADSTALDFLAANSTKIAPASLTGVMALTNGQDSTELTALFGKDDAAANDTLVATGLDSAALSVVAANAGKIATGSITGVMALTSGQDNTALTALFGKDDNVADATVVATGMSPFSLGVLAANAAKIGSGAITGVMGLTSTQDNTELTTLFGKYTGASSTANATGMNGSAIGVLATNIGKLSTITGTLALVGQDATAMTALFGKYGAQLATVSATGLDSAALNVLAANTSKIDTASISGVMALTSGQDSTALTALFGKDDAVANDTVLATSMNSAALNVVAANTGKIASASITGVMALTSGQDSTALTNLFAKDDAVANDTVVATGMDATSVGLLTTNVANIATGGITGTFSVSAAQAATVGLGTKVNATAVVTIAGLTKNGGQTIENGVFQSGNDHLSFTSSSFSGASTFASAETASTYVTLANTSKVELVVGTGVSLVASAAEAAFLFDTATGALTFDADGTGLSAATPVVTLTGINSISPTDFAFV